MSLFLSGFLGFTSFPVLFVKYHFIAHKIGSGSPVVKSCQFIQEKNHPLKYRSTSKEFKKLDSEFTHTENINMRLNELPGSPTKGPPKYGRWITPGISYKLITH